MDWKNETKRAKSSEASFKGENGCSLSLCTIKLNLFVPLGLYGCHLLNYSSTWTVCNCEISSQNLKSPLAFTFL
jgi:hypothetical protein